MERLYSDRADLWVRLSPPGDYAAEAETLLDAIDGHWGGTPPAGLRLLDLGAGAGHSLVHFAGASAKRGAAWALTALDRSAALLGYAAASVPGAERVVGDMRVLDEVFEPGHVFDVVLMHDSADYLLELEDVRAAVAGAASRLAPGGLLLAAPTYLEGMFESGAVTDVDREDDLRLFSYVYRPDPSAPRYELVLLTLEPTDAGGRLSLVEDRHTCGLHTLEQWKAAAADAGLSATWRPADLTAAWAGLLVAVKPV